MGNDHKHSFIISVYNAWNISNQEKIHLCINWKITQFFIVWNMFIYLFFRLYFCSFIQDINVSIYSFVCSCNWYSTCFMIIIADRQNFSFSLSLPPPSSLSLHLSLLTLCVSLIIFIRTQPRDKVLYDLHVSSLSTLQSLKVISEPFYFTYRHLSISQAYITYRHLSIPMASIYLTATQ